MSVGCELRKDQVIVPRDLLDRGFARIKSSFLGTSWIGEFGPGMPMVSKDCEVVESRIKNQMNLWQGLPVDTWALALGMI
jgi:hypothetical protein